MAALFDNLEDGFCLAECAELFSGVTDQQAEFITEASSDPICFDPFRSDLGVTEESVLHRG